MTRHITFTFLFFLLITSTLIGQNVGSIALSPSQLQKGDQRVSLGVSFLPNPQDFAFELFTGGTGSGDPTPAINLHYEYNITNGITIGALVNYYRVDAQQEIALNDISELLDDPECAVECLLPFSIGSGCMCDEPVIKERINVFTMAGRLVYHRSLSPKLGVYSSITAGYSFNRRKTVVERLGDIALDEISTKESKVPTFVYYVTVGGRYYLNEQWAIFGEAGFSNVHLAQLGVSYKL